MPANHDLRPGRDDEQPPRPYKDVRREILESFETSYVEQLMATCGGNLSAASRIARLSRRHLRDLLRKHGFYMELERRRARTADIYGASSHAEHGS